MNLSKTNRLLSLPQINLRPTMIFGIIIFTALLAFEVFNYSTTEFALHDLLGELRFAGVRWATILAIAFCGIDFAGIARLFTPKDEIESHETWYLFGAWLLAATMNAMLTWWGVSMAILNHSLQSTAVLSGETVANFVPIFVAIMVWLIRILIIGTISIAADHMLGVNQPRRVARRTDGANRSFPSPSSSSSVPNLQPNAAFSRRNQDRSRPGTPSRPEPTYSSFSFDGVNQAEREGTGIRRS